ncbi:ABC transporter permease [Lysobacter silvisoli]|uniref:Transport permease protein n=1 Tax=Lysobacter silvisoli TaxID=2293254 RepID=A0A371K3X5_9GAMM|nr:ABC transporter permease [Lysobacter silvisoli]RDZ28629.1 ABC transporter permease [Lysobacter silvisoli]
MNVANIYAVTALDVKSTLRDKTAIFFLLVFPVGFYIFFASFSGAIGSEAASLKYYNTNTPNFTAVLILLISFLNIAPSVAMAKHMGFLNRLMVTPVKVYELWAGFCLRAMLLFAIGYVVMLLAGLVMFGYWPKANPIQLMLPMLVIGFAMLPAGILIGVLFPAPQRAFSAGMLFMQPLLILSGAGMSRDAFPQWAQALSDFVPTTYAVQISRLAWENELFTRASVFPIALLLVFGAVCAFAAAVIFRNSYR